MVLFLAVFTSALADASDFDDGTLQGWTNGNPSGGNITLSTTGGNPGGFLLGEDIVTGGGDVLAVAPSTFSGDLTGFAGLQYDQMLIASGAIQTTAVYLLGTDGTLFRRVDAASGSTGWTPRFVSFADPNSWSLQSGTGSFLDVLANIDELRIGLDVSMGLGNESGVDNVELLGGGVPTVPQSGLILFAALLLGTSIWMIQRRLRFRT